MSTKQSSLPVKYAPGPANSDFETKKIPSLPLSAIQAQISFIQGKVLTIIDATSASDAQNKAIKDLVKDAFRTQLNWIGSLAMGRDNGGDLLAHSGLSE